MEQLKDRYLIFAEAYIETQNATESAKRAGYSPHTAHVQGNRLLKNAKIAEYIEKRMNDKKAEAIWNADQVLEFLTKVASGQIQETIPVGAGGGLQVLQDNVPQMKDRVKAAELLGKRHALFTDKTSNNTEIDVKVQIVDDI